jgi:hypothetical protein
MRKFKVVTIVGSDVEGKVTEKFIEADGFHIHSDKGFFSRGVVTFYERKSEYSTDNIAFFQNVTSVEEAKEEVKAE